MTVIEIAGHCSASTYLESARNSGPRRNGDTFADGVVTLLVRSTPPESTVFNHKSSVVADDTIHVCDLIRSVHEQYKPYTLECP